MTDISDLRASAREFAQRELTEMPSDGRFWRDGWDRCAAFGLHGLMFPSALGGRGGGPLELASTLEAFGEICPDRGLLFAISAHILACAVPIWRFGESERLTALLRELIAGRLIAANAITETASGSDVFAMAATAQRTDGGYLLNGAKTYVTSAPVADVFLTYARTDPAQGFMGVSAFVVPADREGVILGDVLHKPGLAGAPMGEVSFENCQVAEDERLGAEGNGGRIFQVSMDWERALVMAPFVGLMARQLDEAVSNARGRERFGKPIAAFQAVSHRLAEMKLRHQLASLMLYQAVDGLTTEGSGRRIDSCLAKLYISEAVIQNGLDATGLQGAAGVLEGNETARQLLDALPSRIFSGTSDLMRELIARQLLQ